MKKTAIKISCVLSMCLTPQVLLAGATESGSGSKGVETRGGGGGQPSVKEGADRTSSSNSTGQVMSILTGGMFLTQGATDISTGTAPCPTVAGCNVPMIMKGVFEVALGVLSMAQGGAHGSAAGQAANTGIQTNGYGVDSGPGSMDPLNPNNPLSKDPNFKAAFSNLAKLEKDGILNRKNGTINAGGKSYKISDFSSPGAMAAAGIPKGAIDGLMSYASAVEKKAAEKMEKLKLGSMTASTGYEDGGGSGGDSGSVSDDGSAPVVAEGAAVGSGRDPSSLAGMQKNYNGEPIGVAADSIFLMMNRRYKVKESQESFFTDAELALQK